jgi:hypothetical protein
MYQFKTSLDFYVKLYHTYQALLCLANSRTLACSFYANKHFQPSSTVKEHTRFQFLSCSWCRWDKSGTVSVFQGTRHGMSDHSKMSSHLHLSWGQASPGAENNRDSFHLPYWFSHPNDASLRQWEILHAFPSLLLGPLLQMDQPTSFIDTVRFWRPKFMGFVKYRDFVIFNLWGYTHRLQIKMDDSSKLCIQYQTSSFHSCEHVDCGLLGCVTV